MRFARCPLGGNSARNYIAPRLFHYNDFPLTLKQIIRVSFSRARDAALQTRTPGAKVQAWHLTQVILSVNFINPGIPSPAPTLGSPCVSTQSGSRLPATHTHISHIYLGKDACDEHFLPWTLTFTPSSHLPIHPQQGRQTSHHPDTRISSLSPILSSFSPFSCFLRCRYIYVYCIP